MNRVLVSAFGISIALGLFWFLDFPQTVRLKAAIVRWLPLAPRTINSTIEKLCQGARPTDPASCYLDFRSEEAEAAVQCSDFAAQLAHNKEWSKFEENGHFIYGGSDAELKKYGLLFYYPAECMFVSLGPSSKTTTFSLAAKTLFKFD